VVFDGIVADIDYNPIYNTYIIIDHGDGYATLYANLDDSSIEVSSQAYIESGAIIGNTLNNFDNKKNNSYGLLYFGILRTKDSQEVKPYNPREWIR
jgi:murein DD-endopeptidase MepM/ murein hydrolase activator NlpD